MGRIGEQNTEPVFIDAFLQNNRLDPILRQLEYHPGYKNHFLRVQHFILRGDGPLPYDYRHYIAIMAAARHYCTYLVKLHKEEFLSQGGKPEWLLGLNHIPKKLHDLNEINKILAHQPWLLNKSHIEKLTKGKDNWSVGEIVHAVVLLAHFHSLCSFVFSCETFDEPQQNQNPPVPSASSKETSEPEESVEELMEKMQNLLEQRTEEPSDEELVERFEKVGTQEVLLTTENESESSFERDILRYMDDPYFRYENFDMRRDLSRMSGSTFSIQDCSWGDHAYSLLNRFYNDVGTMLDEKFKVAYNLTYYTMGNKKNVDTTIFRRAVWNYIHCVLGIRHDDYNYKEVNELVERNLKSYIKTVCCFPDRTNKHSYKGVIRAFRHSERVHVNLMLFEAKMQAELLYALCAIMQYMR